MGLPAVLATGQPAPRVNDIVIKGYLLSVEEGSAGKRVLIGFGSGNAELKTVVEGFEMTAQGPRQLGSGELAREKTSTATGYMPSWITSRLIGL